MEIYTTSSVSPKYQITIPKSVRQFFSTLKPGTRVGISLNKKSNQILITPKKTLDEVLAEIPTKQSSKKINDFSKIREIADLERIKQIHSNE